jgi:hypothetical protein
VSLLFFILYDVSLLILPSVPCIENVSVAEPHGSAIEKKLTKENFL